jgi:hypothetical protein
MAVNVGTTPERWLQGLDRLVAATARFLPRLPMLLRRRDRVSPRWVMERGPVRASAPVNAIGGFPGSLRSANRLESTSVIVTDRYMVVGEGSTGGFALPMADVLAAELVRPSRQANVGMVVHYRDGSGVGTFALDFLGLARGASGGRRAEEVLRVLKNQGVQRLGPGRVPGALRLTLTWEDARRHDHEPLMWSGLARASVGGWYGAVQHPCRVWITGESLFWCCSEGEGVNRLALTDIVDVRDGVADRVCIAFRDSGGHRCDLPFDFDTCTSGTQPMQQRMRFLDVLASCGVAVSTAPLPLAPWRSNTVGRLAGPAR